MAIMLHVNYSMLEFNEKLLRMFKDYILNFIIFGVYVWRR
jgi:hypothetical protein